MRPHPWRQHLRSGLAVVLALGFPLACVRRPERDVRRPITKPRALPSLPRLGYTLQAGAFAQVEHAARFTEALKAQGLEAAYYGSKDGLFRVRFGDFPTKAAARQRGAALKAQGVLEGFWVVSPDGSAPGASGDQVRRPTDEGGVRSSLVATARGYLGVPYLFGGTTERGFDCSGLTGAVYRLNGLQLPRSSRGQFEAGRPIPLDDAQAGDLLFFDTSGDGRVNHVGVYLGRGSFIHAPRSGQVIREDELADAYFRRSLVGVRSYL